MRLLCLVACSTLLVAVVQAVVIGDPSSHAQADCTFTFATVTPNLNALQYHLDYYNVGGFEGSGASVVCSNSDAGALSAFNDDEVFQTLYIAHVALTPMSAFVNLASCHYVAPNAPYLSQFRLTVDDSVDNTPVGNLTNVCGAPETGASLPYSRDALVILKAAIGLPVTCQLCECDTNDDASITSSDSLRSLRSAVGLPGMFCSGCAGAPGYHRPSATAGVYLTTACTFTCPPSPDLSCHTGTKSSFAVSESADDAKDSLKWKLGGGALTTQADLGDPIGGNTDYTLCVYDSTSNVDSLVREITVGHADTTWTSKDPKGLQYKVSGAAQADGVTTVSFKTGEAGKSSVQIAGKGANLALPAPATTEKYFNQDSRVVVQLHSNASPLCWSAEYDAGAGENTATKFSQKTP